MTTDALLQLIADKINDNTTGDISPARMREVLTNLARYAGVTINDSSATTTATYSGNKINALIDAAKSAGIKIDDVTHSTTTVYSASKVKQLIDDVATNAGVKIDDVTASGTTTYSGSKIEQLIAGIPQPEVVTGSNGIIKTGSDFTLGGNVTDWIEFTGNGWGFGNYDSPIWGFYVNTGEGGVTLASSRYLSFGGGTYGTSFYDDYAGGYHFNTKENGYWGYTGSSSNGFGKFDVQATDIFLESWVKGVGTALMGLNIKSSTGTATFFDNRTTKKGIEYAADYSAGFTLRSLVDKAYVDGKVASANVVVNDASTSVKGIVKLSVAPTNAAEPIAVGTNDTRLSDARTPLAHNQGAETITSGTLDNARLNTTVVRTDKANNFTTVPQINGTNIATVYTPTTKSATISDDDANPDTFRAYTCALDKDEIRLTIGTNTSITLSGGEADKVYKVVLIQDSTGMKSVNFSNLKNTSNVFSLTANAKDILRIRFTESLYIVEEHYSI